MNEIYEPCGIDRDTHKMYRRKLYADFFADIAHVFNDYRGECLSLQAENARLREIVDNLPKVPTSSYEKGLAEDNMRLREALEKANRFITNTHQVIDDIETDMGVALEEYTTFDQYIKGMPEHYKACAGLLRLFNAYEDKPTED